ncbi:MAG: nicotinate-nucleotide adenylyltransferase [Tannerella sp.]|nr:nicotinate-nucleotide adenylyltransferase [Tannerella sp.]
MTQVGLYGGSFNPVHIGHLALANWLREYAGLDEVWFMPSPQNPLKASGDLLDAGLRLEMLRLAVGDVPGFRVSDYEYHRPAPSYTIDTLRSLKADFPDKNFHLLIGADNWVDFPLWKDYREILATTPLLIYPRRGCEVSVPARLTQVRYFSAAPLVEIASADIRRAFQEGRDLRFFLPESVRGLWLNACRG